MTSGNPFYEFSKYGVSAFVLLGMYYSGFSKNALPYWIFLALLIPGVLIGTYSLNYDAQVRKTISFNISGPVCLGLASLYTYRRAISNKDLNNIVLMMGLPVVAMTAYLILYTPNIRDVITGTSSSFETSGGFGPNQVSTLLGLGMFVFFSRAMFCSPNKIMLILNCVTALFISYRGLVTFSRGGMITAVAMVLFLLGATYLRVNSRGRVKMKILMGVIFLAMAAVWIYSSRETGGLIEKRYANQDAAGRVKESQFTGRERIFDSELNFFLENPIFGIGVARGADLRKETMGQGLLSHNEIGRMLAEHGSLGITALMILFITPLVLYLDNKNHVFLICFLIFWLLTINHAAMRTAAPAFVYSLTLLKIVLKDEKPVVPGQQTFRSR